MSPTRHDLALGAKPGTGAVTPRFPSVEGENSAERWPIVGTVSAKSPTSRKEREKWGTRLLAGPFVLGNDLVERLALGKHLGVSLLKLFEPCPRTVAESNYLN